MSLALMEFIGRFLGGMCIAAALWLLLRLVLQPARYGASLRARLPYLLLALAGVTAGLWSFAPLAS